jgi:Right handed beta helix region
VYFGHIQNLKLCNLRTYNSNGFAFLAEQCRNIDAEKIVFAPDGSRLFTGPRDAWKLFKCQGRIHISGLSVRGVRMDGQNVHSNWLTLIEKRSSHKYLFFSHYTYAPIVASSPLEYYEGYEKKSVLIADSEHSGPFENGHLYSLTLEEPLPETQTKGALLAAACWEPDTYICVKSKFINIAGAGHLLRIDNVLLEENEYRNNMNPGVLLGAELPTHQEGGHATNVIIRKSVFDNCGFFPRYEAGGCIGVKSSGFYGPFNTEITIEDNLFRNAEVGIDLIDAGKVTELRNRFENIVNPIFRKL